MLNLLSNACKFTEKGTVSLYGWPQPRERRRLDLNPRCRHRHRHDSRNSSPDSSRNSPRPTARRRGNMAAPGLGLAITDRLCRMHGRHRHVESKPDFGTSFTCAAAGASRPAYRHAAPIETSIARLRRSRARRAHQPRLGDRRRCHRARSDAPLSESRGLRRGHRRRRAEGLEFARELKPSVITLDVFMPDMDGWSVLQAIKEDAELTAYRSS